MARSSATATPRWLEPRAGSRLRGAPMSSRCSYWTGSVGADHRRSRQVRRRLVTDRRVQQARREAATLDVPQHLAAGRARGGDRCLAAEARERQRALRVDLADPRRVDLGALGEVRAIRRRRPRDTGLRSGRSRRSGRPSSPAGPRAGRPPRRAATLIATTTSLTGALFTTISPTPEITSSRPAEILRSATIVDTR